MRKFGITTADHSLLAFGKNITIPKGTEAVFVPSKEEWAVASARLLATLTGDVVSPYHKNVYLPKKIIKPSK